MLCLTSYNFIWERALCILVCIQFSNYNSGIHSRKIEVKPAVMQNFKDDLDTCSEEKGQQKVRRKKSPEDRFKNLKPRDKEYREPTEIAGLYCRVQPNGKKSWQYRYKNTKGKWGWVGLGSYPKIGYLQAREKAEKMSNGDIEVKTQAELNQIKVEEEQALFSHLIYEWLDIKKDEWKPETFKKEKQSIEKHLMPIFGHRQYKKITPKEWLDFFRDIQATKRIYNRVEKLVSCCIGAYNLAKFKGTIEYNPLENIYEFLSKKKSENMKHVSIDELPELIFTIRNYSSRSIAIALELMIHMLPRPQEMRLAKWEQFNFEEAVWIRPASIMKMEIEHAIPLSKQVIALLKELRKISNNSDYLFPSRNDINRPISNLTFNAALNRSGYRGRQNPHGFRHIGSTALNEQYSEKSQVIETALSHLKKGVKGAYDKSAHLKERYEIMQWWSDYVESLLK